MRTGIRITLLTAPLLVLPAAGTFYTHLNIGNHLFVDRLGCGCTPGFNTNVLSLIVAAVLLLGAASCWWIAARELPRRWFWSLAGAFSLLGLEFFRHFMAQNLWL
jgi:hypothetical protein